MNTTILTLNKTPYENGKASGQYFKSVLNQEILKDTPLKKRPELKEKCIHMMYRLQKEYPDFTGDPDTEYCVLYEENSPFD